MEPFVSELSQPELKQIPVEQIRRGQFQPRGSVTDTGLSTLRHYWHSSIQYRHRLFWYWQ